VFAGKWRLRASLAVALVASFQGSGCGDSGEQPRLEWERPPQLFVPDNLPGDRTLIGWIRNTGSDPVELRAGDLRLISRDGRRIEGNAVFLQAFTRGLYPPTRRPPELPEGEERRTGRTALIEPGRSVPLTVAWRQRPKSLRPVQIELDGTSLPVPTSVGK
jgi:hypothetical protein